MNRVHKSDRSAFNAVAFAFIVMVLTLIQFWTIDLPDCDPALSVEAGRCMESRPPKSE